MDKQTRLEENPAGSGADAWWKSAVVYQIYPRSFADSNADGIGDLEGIRSKLPHLQRLGIDVIWLSPIYRSPHADNGYDISDYRDIDPIFGTLSDFDLLLEDVHKCGMKLIMDLVVNHTSDEHPWFVESRSSLDSPKRDWYIWRQPRAGLEAGQPGAEPTNWESFFSGPTWTLDETTGQYYLHLFSAKQPDLNWDNPELRRAIYEMMRWWLDRGVDGFRMDVINLISKTPGFPDGIVSKGRVLGDGFPHYASGPRIHDYLQEMHREVFAGRSGSYLTVGEMPGVTVEDAVLFTDPDRGELDMVFQFEHVSLDHGTDKFDVKPLRLKALKASLGRWQNGLAVRGWNSLYWNNHDQPRAVSRFGNDDPAIWRVSATALAIVLHLHRGTPYIYQGEEIGMTNASFATIDDFRDVESLNYYRHALDAGRDPGEVLAGLRRMSRDNARTPVQWDSTAHAGFSATEPWMPVAPNHTWLNAAAQYDDAGSVFNMYRRLISFRHENPVIAHGSFHMLEEQHPQLYAYRRALDGVVVLVIANLSNESTQWTPPDNSHVLFSNIEERDAEALRPWEARVYRLIANEGVGGS